MKMKLLNLIKTDLIKEKRSPLWIVIFIIPLGTSAAMFFDMYVRYDYLYKKSLEKGITSWEMIIRENHGILNWAGFLPLFVAIIAVIIHQTEFSQNSWKSLLSLPVIKSSVYISKFIIILFFSFIMITLNAVGLIVVGKLIGFPEQLQFILFIKYIVYEFIAILGVAAIHTWLSSYFKNAIIGVAVGFFGMIIAYGLPFEHPQIAKFFPYSFSFFAGGFTGFNMQVALIGGIISGIVFMLIGILEFRKREII
jgi:hypothetical protein